MGYSLTEEQELIQQTARDFAQQYIEPVAAEIDRTAAYPAEIIKNIGEQGLLGLYLPENVGGAEAGVLSYLLVVEQLARYSGSVAEIVIEHSSKAAYALQRFGNVIQQEKYLADLSSGEKLGAVAISEPDAAPGFGPLKVMATKKDGGYELSGTKSYVANGGVADTYLVLAQTGEAAKNDGFSLFIVDARAAGVTVGRRIGKMGLRGCQSTELTLDKVFVFAEEGLLGNVGDGQNIVAETHAFAAIAAGAQMVGIAQRALDDALAYSKQRIQFKRPISSFPAIQTMLAEAATNIHLARLAVYYAGEQIDKGEDFILAAAMVKLAASKIGQTALIDIVQVEGGYGYSEDMIASRLYRDVQGTAIRDRLSDYPEKVIVKALLD